MIRYLFRLIYCYLTILCISFCNLQSSYAEKYQISKSIIQGNKKIDGSVIIGRLQKTSGELSDKELSDGARSIYATGFFDDVRVAVERDKGANIAVYHVSERAAVRKIFITGNKEVGDKDLSEALTFETRAFLDRAKISLLVKRAKTLYESRGYLDAEISYNVTPVAPQETDENEVDITFEIKEGLRYKIESIQFKGLKNIDASEIQNVLGTRPYSWWKSWILGTGRLNREMLENDKLLIRQYFLDRGYIDGSVSDPEIFKEEDGELKLVFHLEEGPQYQIGDITVKGDLIEDNREKTLTGIESKVGEIFSASQIRKDSFIISDSFGDLGYAFTNVTPATSLNRSEKKVDVVFDVNRGNLAKINMVNIKGNTKTYDNVIRRELKIHEADRYSSSKIKRSEVLLRRLGYFEDVSIATKASSVKDAVDLDVVVKEASTGTFSVGAGYSTSDGVLFNSRLSEANVFGTGRKLDLNLDLGTERNNLILSLDDPRYNDTYLSLGGDLFITEREFDDFDREIKGAGVTLGYPLEQVFGEAWQDINASLKYEFDDVDISSVDMDAAQLVKDSKGKTTASGLTPRLTRNTIDNPLNPSSGSRQVLSIEVTGLGGEEEYYLIEGRTTHYLPLFETGWGNTVFSYRGTIGYGDSYGSGSDFLPLFRRYFPGGINSIRGYDARSLGPKDANGSEYGGNKEYINNFEVIFPLAKSAGFKGVLFYDIGQAFDEDAPIELKELKKAYGGGIRWNSPVGPLRLEFGFPVSPDEGESGMKTLFSFGMPY
jgi:outer membrane protein insertion porin family